MRVLVTGGAGFIGSHVVEELVRTGHTVQVVDDLSTGRAENVPPQVALVRMAVEDQALAEVFAAFRPEGVVHCAAQTSVAASWEDPRRDAQSNAAGTANLLQACARHGRPPVVYLSSAAVYGEPQHLPVGEDHPLRPSSPYGLTKLTGESYLELFRTQYGLPAVSLRLANVYGPRQRADADGGVVAIFLQRLLAGLPLEVHGDGRQTRDFVHVSDVARAVRLALERLSRAAGPGRAAGRAARPKPAAEAGVVPEPGAGDGATPEPGAGNGTAPEPATAEGRPPDVCNVSTGEETSILALIARLEQATGRRAEIRYTAPRPGDIRRSCLDGTRLRRWLDWSPRLGLADGLRQIAR